MTSCEHQHCGVLALLSVTVVLYVSTPCTVCITVSFPTAHCTLSSEGMGG